MSRFIGDSLVAGGSLSPDAEAKTVAVDRLVACVYFYGWPEGRGPRGCLREAIEALSPEALRCIEEHGEREAYKRFCADYEPEDT